MNLKRLCASAVAACLFAGQVQAGVISPPTFGLPAPYLGEVATRAMVPPNFTGTNKMFMARTMHIARDTISTVQVCFPNWYVAGSSGETAISGAAATTASVEYPSGTFNQLKFSGSATGSIPSGQTLCSDPVSLSTAIPNGARFWVRQWFSSASGIPYVAGGEVDGTYEVATFAPSGVADQTMGGTITSSGSNVMMEPVAIIAKTIRPAVLLVGDSRCVGQNDSPNDATGDFGELARSVGPYFAYIAACVNGDTLLDWTTAGKYAQRLALAQYTTHVVDELGVNDFINNGSTSAQVVSARTTVAGYFGTRPVIGTTLPPITTSTDSFATSGNQTVRSGSSQKDTFNGQVRAGISGEIAYWDVADAIDSSRTGLWPTNGTANYYTSDGVHESANAEQMIFRSGLLFPGWIFRGHQ